MFIEIMLFQLGRHLSSDPKLMNKGRKGRMEGRDRKTNLATLNFESKRGKKGRKNERKIDHKSLELRERKQTNR